jgi:hypothetical protein
MWYAYRQAGAESIPKGPKGEKHPADVVGAAVRVADEPDDRETKTAHTPGQQLGKLGGAARAKKLTPEQRTEIARKAAARRWSKP